MKTNFDKVYLTFEFQSLQQLIFLMNIEQLL